MWVSAAIIWAIPVMGTFIAVMILIGTAIYLALNNRDSIQKWLIRTSWRRIPVNERETKKMQEEYRRRESLDLSIWSAEMEMEQLKLALGIEG